MHLQKKEMRHSKGYFVVGFNCITIRNDLFRRLYTRVITKKKLLFRLRQEFLSIKKRQYPQKDYLAQLKYYRGNMGE